MLYQTTPIFFWKFWKHYTEFSFLSSLISTTSMQSKLGVYSWSFNATVTSRVVWDTLLNAPPSLLGYIVIIQNKDSIVGSFIL